ncbi:hypothetical protein LUTEI9C_50154 [Luteimonas sp. 9C]|nr:hypothetical protein LUTEI9C_50154 [Luteimonas sp. 9C]
MSTAIHAPARSVRSSRQASRTTAIIVSTTAPSSAATPQSPRASRQTRKLPSTTAVTNPNRVMMVRRKLFRSLEIIVVSPLAARADRVPDPAADPHGVCAGRTLNRCLERDREETPGGGPRARTAESARPSRGRRWCPEPESNRHDLAANGF